MKQDKTTARKGEAPSMEQNQELITATAYEKGKGGEPDTMTVRHQGKKVMLEGSFEAEPPVLHAITRGGARTELGGKSADVLGQITFKKNTPPSFTKKQLDLLIYQADLVALPDEIKTQRDARGRVIRAKGDDTPPDVAASADMLAKGLEKALEITGATATMNAGQKIYAKNWLFAVSSYAAELYEENQRLHGATPARAIPKASSVLFSTEAEQKFYGDLLSGKMSDADARRHYNPQDIVFTTHPNFSSKANLAALNHDVIKDILKLPPKLMGELAQGQPDAVANLVEYMKTAPLGQHLLAATKEMTPRKHRNREDEMNEATVALIPRLYDGLNEEVTIMLKRAASAGVKVPKTLSFNQVKSMANLTTDNSTWFTDGDGKRTSHAWDNDYAIPAIKVAAMAGYMSDLQKIKDDIGHRTDVSAKIDTLMADMGPKIEKVAKFRDAAAKRMLALTALQAHADERGGPVPREDVRKLTRDLRRKAREADTAYRTMIIDPVTRAMIPEMREALTADFGAKVMELAELLKAEEAKGVEFRKIDSHFNSATPLSAVDALIIKAAKGDYPMQIERRENANQHKEGMRLFMKAIGYNGVDEELVGFSVPGTNTQLTMQDISEARRASTGEGEKYLRKVLEVVDDLASQNRKGQLVGKDKVIADKLEKILHNVYRVTADQATPALEDAMPLELGIEESVFLDGVSPLFISGKHGRGAYRRIIIAEAGSPPNEMLAKNNEHEVMPEAKIRDGNDILTLNIFKNLLKSNVDIVSLYEDPAAILHTPAMLANKLQNPQYHDALGLDMTKADEKTLRNPKGKEITAYQFMKQQGYSDENMAERKMNIKELKKAYVYVGPHKMLANSDSAKRGTLAASILNQISVIESYEEGSKNLVEGPGGKKYMFINQTYLGQGGALARTTGTDSLINTITEQGQHATMTTGVYTAMKSVLRGTTRLVAKQEQEKIKYDDDGEPIVTRAAFAEGGKNDAHKRIALETMALGNPFGFRVDIDTIKDLKASALQAIYTRIRNTRDDVTVPGSGFLGDGNGKEDEPHTRYEELLRKYGQDFMENYSARPAAKGSSNKLDFVGIRAIGLAAKEYGVFSNIVGVSEMFNFAEDGKLSNLNSMAKLYMGDPTVKHNFDAAAYVANMSFKTLPMVWERGEVTFTKDEAGEVTLHKKGKESALLRDVVKAFDHKDLSYKGFDAADLALAKIHQQTEQFVSGLAQLRAAIDLGPSKRGANTGNYTLGKADVPVVKDPIELIPEYLQPTVLHARGLAEGMMRHYREMEAKEGVVDNMKKFAKKPDAMSADAMSLRMAKDAYYQLMETSLEQQALGRVKTMGQEHALAV